MQSLNVPPQGQDYWEDEDSEPGLSVWDWKQAVASGSTRAGYWEWAHDARRCDSDMEGQPEE